MKPFKVVIVEDVKLEMKGTLEILRTEIPEAEVIGTAMNEDELWTRLREHVPELLLLDLGLGGSTTVGIDICKQVRQKFPDMRILIFTGEVLNERLWADALKAGANGIILKAGEAGILESGLIRSSPMPIFLEQPDTTSILVSTWAMMALWNFLACMRVSAIRYRLGGPRFHR